LEVKLEFKAHNYMFNSYEMELYSEGAQFTGAGEPPEYYFQKSVHWGGAGGTDPIYVYLFPFTH
jgi:hypothetical protein